MSEFVEVKTSELPGNRLRWAVGKAMGLDVQNTGNTVWVRGRVPHAYPETSNDYYDPLCWQQGGPLIDAHNIKVESYPKELGEGRASVRLVFTGKVCWQSGDSVLIAAGRAIVAAKLGETVLVPAELLGVDR